MMKITIENLGPIHKFEFDLEKDLHLIYGENGIGKSYAAYCIYDILKNFITCFNIRSEPYPRLVDLDVFTNDEKVKTINERLLRKLKNHSLFSDICDELTELIRYILKNILIASIENSFLNTYSSIKNLQNSFSNERLQITLSLNNYVISFGTIGFEHFDIFDFKIENLLTEVHYKEETYPGDGSIPEFTNCYLDVVYKNHSSRSHYHYPTGRDTVALDLSEEIIVDIINQLQSYIGAIYFLPASRSGLYQGLNSFSPIIAELSKHRFYVKSSIEIPSLSEPIADYFLQLSAIENDQKITTFTEIINEIETSILKGSVNYNTETKKLNFSPENTDLILDISNASSMVAELSPIVAYLKHIISSGEGYNVLFLEEPEAHLHPEIQVKLMEIFAELTQYNIKVIMTSHSNYMFNKLGNLLLEKKILADRAGVYHMVMTEKGSIVSDDMTSSEDGIEDHNFAEVSEQLYEERMKLYETAG